MTPSPRASAKDLELGLNRPGHSGRNRHGSVSSDVSDSDSTECAPEPKSVKRIRWERNRKIAKATFLLGLLATGFLIGICIYRCRSLEIDSAEKLWEDCVQEAGMKITREKALRTWLRNRFKIDGTKFRFTFQAPGGPGMNDRVNTHVFYECATERSPLYFKDGTNAKKMADIPNFLVPGKPAFGLPPADCDLHTANRGTGTPNGKRIICAKLFYYRRTGNVRTSHSSMYWVMLDCAVRPNVGSYNSTELREPCLGLSGDKYVWFQKVVSDESEANWREAEEL